MTHDTSPHRTPTSRVLVTAMLFLLLFAGMFALFATECSTAQRSGVGCLQSLTPVIEKFKRWYLYPRDYYTHLFRCIFAGVGAILACVLLASLVRRKHLSVRLCLLVAIAALGEYFVLQKDLTLGTTFTLLAPILIAVVSLGFPVANDEQNALARPIRAAEFVALTVISLLLFCTQFYLLNHIPYGWDTEFCPFRYLYWSNWSGLLLHESGHHPQTSAGLSWNLVMTLLGHVDEPDDYYLYLRYLSSGIAATKFVLLFFFMRSLCGTFSAFFAAALLGFGPPENWWSREPSLHQLPGLLAIILLWAWTAAWRSPTVLHFCALSLMIGVVRLAYPSGMFLAFGPPLFFGTLVLFRSRQWLQHLPKILITAFGLAFWLGWRTLARGLHRGDWTLLPPLDVPHHFAPPTLLERVSILAKNSSDVLSSTFLYQVNPTHWTVPLVLPPHRCITSIVVILLLLALGRMLRGRSGQLGFLLLIALFLTFLPGLLTEVAARRIGVSFLVLIIIAAREAQYLTSILTQDGNALIARLIRWTLPVATCAYFIWISSAIHFSVLGGTPAQVVRGKMMREALEDDALIVFLSGLPNCDTFFSVYRDLRSRNCKTAWVCADYENSPDTQQLIDAPEIRTKNWIYEFTDMKACLEEHTHKAWKKIIFLVSEGSFTESLITRLRNRYPDAPYTYKKQPNPHGGEYSVFVLTVTR